MEGAIKKSLARLKLDYVDLYLMHWSLATKKNAEGNEVIDKIPIYKTWGEMEKLVERGLTKSIGVSNFNVQSILDMLTYAKIEPACNQIELHPYLVQDGLVKFLQKNNILPVAYCPLVNTQYGEFPPQPIFEHEVILELAEKYSKTPAQIILNWSLARGHSVIPKTSKIERLSENYACQSFTMTKDDVEKVTALNINYRTLPSKNFAWALNLDLFA